MTRRQFTILVAVGMAPLLHAESWPQWRGPLGTGVSSETGLPTEWSRDQNVAWKAPLGGLGVSSPIVWGDRVFVTYQIGAGALRPGNHPTLVQGRDPVAAGEHPLGGQRPGGPDAKVAFAVAAFGSTDGKLLWEYRLDAEGPLPPVHEKRNLATSSPVTDGESVYAWFDNGQVAALDRKGKVAWTRHLGREHGAFDLDWGASSSPALYRDRRILVCYHNAASYLLAVDKRTGKDLWRLERQKGLRSYSTPLVVEGPQGPEVVVNTSEGVDAYDPATGRLLWHFAEANRFPIPMPVYQDGVLYMTRGYRSSPYLALRVGGRGDVSKTQVVWRVDTGGPYVSSLVHYQGLVYMANEGGIVMCIDAKTGGRVWQQRMNGIFTASPVAADGKIYLLSETGETVVLRAGREPRVLARNDLGEQLIASPAISGGLLFIRGDRHLFAIRGSEK